MEETHALTGLSGGDVGPRDSLAMAEHAAVERIRRLLAELHLPCECQGEVDKVMDELTRWEGLQLKRRLLQKARQSVLQFVAGYEFVEDMLNTPAGDFDPDTCRDHAETLRLLSGLARTAADLLDRATEISNDRG